MRDKVSIERNIPVSETSGGMISLLVKERDDCKVALISKPILSCIIHKMPFELNSFIQYYFCCPSDFFFYMKSRN